MSVQPVSRRQFLQASGAAGGAFAGASAFGLPVRAKAQSAPAGPAESGVTRALARYIVSSRPADIPERVRKEATRSIFHWVGCALGGSNHDAVDRAVATYTEFAGAPHATLIGRSERVDALHAALINGISTHVLDFDDTHLATIIHPSGPVAPALLALCERRRVSGAEFLHAFVLGTEVELRIGKAVYPEHYDLGFHITGTAGVFGAAAAAGKLLGLDEQQMVWALGTAATQAAGLREMFGGMCKSLHVGRAAQHGLEAALLAARGFTSSDRGIEAPRGFAFVMSPARRLDVITTGLGETFEILQNSYKPFPCGVVLHPIIDGCIQLHDRHGLTADRLDRIELRVHPLVLELTGRKAPASGLEGKFSVYHSAAIAAIRGAAGLQQYTDDAVRDPQVVALRSRVAIAVDAGIRDDEAFIAMTLKDGQRIDVHVEHAVGSVHRPMTDADLEKKFRGLADGRLPAAARDALMSMCWSIGLLSDVAVLAHAAARPA